MTNDLQQLFICQDRTARWRAEHENSAARLELAQRDERAAFLISQSLPVERTGLDRERLALCLAYLRHGDVLRLDRALDELIAKQEASR